jgi:hypothetical protein
VNLPVQVLEAVGKHRCLLFSGRRSSGEAVGAGYPGEKALARKLAGPGLGLAEAFAKFEAQEGRAALVDRVEALLSTADAAPGAFHHEAVQRFPIIFTTSWDDLFERAAAAEGVKTAVSWRGEPFPEPEEGSLKIHHLWGGFEGPQGLALTAQDRRDCPPPADEQRYWRHLLRAHVLLFAGFRPDEAEFEILFDELVAGYGGALPRTHWAVAQGRISDVQWQKWVWRGMLLFTANPSEVTQTLAEKLDA